MSRETCRLPGCDREPGQDGNPVAYRTRQFCSQRHDLKYDHLKDDARDARQSVEQHHDDVPRHDSGGGRL